METNRFRLSGTFTCTLIGISTLITLMPVVRAQEVPYGTSIPMSSRDRVYTADQISNTVSVIDPSRNQLLGVIRLGEPITAVLGPAGAFERICAAAPIGSIATQARDAHALISVLQEEGHEVLSPRAVA